MTTVNDRHPNFRNNDGKLYLVRCYSCSPDHGRENYALSVSYGQCSWCGWTDPAQRAWDNPQEAP